MAKKLLRMNYRLPYIDEPNRTARSMAYDNFTTKGY